MSSMSSRSSIIWNAMPRFQPKWPSASANSARRCQRARLAREREQRRALLGDDLVVLRLVEPEVELVRGFEALAAHQHPQRPDELRHRGGHAAAVHEVERFGQGEVAGQHRRVVAVLETRGEFGASRVHLVDDVVVEERGEVHQSPPRRRDGSAYRRSRRAARRRAPWRTGRAGWAAGACRRC